MTDYRSGATADNSEPQAAPDSFNNHTSFSLGIVRLLTVAQN
jgi:hypothetical protein